VKEQAITIAQSIVHRIEGEERVVDQRGIVERDTAPRERTSERGSPIGVGAAIHERRLQLAALLERQRVVLLVGILASGEKSGLRIAQHGTHVGERALEIAAHEFARCPQFELRKDAKKSRVILGHLFEVRNRPVARRGIPEKTAFDRVIHAAVSHRAHRVCDKFVRSCVVRKAPVGKQEFVYLGLRKFRRLFETAELLVVPFLQRSGKLDDCGKRQFVGARNVVAGARGTGLTRLFGDVAFTLGIELCNLIERALHVFRREVRRAG